MPEEKKNESSLSTDDLLKKNLDWSEVLYKQNKKILRRMTMMTVGNYFRLLLIIAPLIFALIYLPPLLKPMIQQYQELLGNNKNGSNFDIQKLIEEYQRSQR